MIHHYAESGRHKPRVETRAWIGMGLWAAMVAIVAVLIVQAIALARWPGLAQFGPLDSYARSALFTAVPALVATALFRWLAANRPEPVTDFIRISLVVLLVSLIPDYILPVPGRTFLASTVAAFLHMVAAALIVWVLTTAYRRQASLA